MSKEIANRNSRIYSAAVMVAGISIWLAAITDVLVRHGYRTQLILIALVPLIIITGMFPNTFPLPLILKCNHERLTFTLSDALVLFVACWLGPVPAIFIAGIEGFTSSRRTVHRLSSNLFSFGMMSLVATASATTLSAVLRYGFDESLTGTYTFPAAILALLVANIVHISVNTGLISAFFALRNGNSVWRNWTENFLWAAPLFLPTSAVAGLMYIALQYDVLIMIAIGAPIMIAIYFGQRRYRESIQERINVMEKGHRETIEALAVTINAKDEVTHEHVLRVQIYAAGVARLLGCTDSEIEALRAGALLHDIGKIAVPDYILNKPGKLTSEEFEKMKTHTLVGAQILGRVDFPYPVVPIVRNHHERWDGRGYPDGLKGEEIPLTARILTVVDCFDAVREDRQYRRAMTRQEAIDLIMRDSGTMYDPRVVGTFITHLPEFEAEIQAHRDVPVPTFGIEPVEQLSEAARHVAPAAGFAEASETDKTPSLEFTHHELKSLYDLAQTINAARTQQELISSFTEKLKTLVPYDCCAVTLAETGGYTVAHAAGEYAELLLHRKIAPGEGVSGWVLANHKPFSNTDPKLDLPPALAERFAGYRTLTSFPLIKDTLLLGAVTLYSVSLAEYTAGNRKLLEEALKLLAVAISAKSPVELLPVKADAPVQQDEFKSTLSSEALH